MPRMMHAVLRALRGGDQSVSVALKARAPGGRAGWGLGWPWVQAASVLCPACRCPAHPCLSPVCFCLPPAGAGPVGRQLPPTLPPPLLTSPPSLHVCLPTFPFQVLDLWVDSFNPEFIERSMAGVIRDLMLALWGHIQPHPYPHGTKARRWGCRRRRGWLLLLLLLLLPAAACAACTAKLGGPPGCPNQLITH